MGEANPEAVDYRKATAGSADHDGFGFETTWSDGRARTGRLITPHGVIETPAFIAVGTSAAVKAVGPQVLEDVGQQAVFANTYHLYLRPGAELIARLGGLHRFMGWNRPIMTDSGGFQVFSLGAGVEQKVGKIGMFPGAEGARRAPAGGDGRSMVEIGEDGVAFRSHLDGSRHVLTPEKSIRLQRELGADVILAFDECTSPLHDEEYTRRAMERTHRWADRSLAAFRDGAPLHGSRQALYGIVQGGWYEDLRTESASFVAGRGFDGIAIGGSLGKEKEDMLRVLDITLPLLPNERPRHLLGIGEIPDLFAGAARGIDTFDCVAPTRNARNGGLLVRTIDGERPRNQRINIRNARFADDPKPVDPDCPCMTCRRFSRAYLRHLFKAEQLLACHLATVHNLTVINVLMAEIRSALRSGTLPKLAAHWLGDEAVPRLLGGTSGITEQLRVDGGEA